MVQVAFTTIELRSLADSLSGCADVPDWLSLNAEASAGTKLLATWNWVLLR